MDAYFDIFSGISGNMVLGALLDLGLEQEDLEQELDKLGISGEYEINVEKVSKHGIGGTYVNVKLVKDDHQHGHDHEPHNSDHKHDKYNQKENDGDAHKDEHDHSHSCDHSHNNDDNDAHQRGNHSHSHKHDEDGHQCRRNEDHERVHEEKHKHHHDSHDGDKEHSHQHGRNLSDINQIIDNSSLSEGVKSKSRKIFLNLARAEAKIHRKSVDEIHFHEVGAVDAIVDIIGAVIGLELLGIDRIYASRIHTGTGFVSCDHGQMPVPAPATMELLKGVPIYATGIEKEMVTPTGAAIISTLAHKFGPRPEMEIANTGYGAGGYELEIPNLLRVNTGKIINESGKSDSSQKKKK